MSKFLICILALIIANGCQAKSKREEADKAPENVQSSAPTPPGESKPLEVQEKPEEPKPSKSAPEMTINLKKDQVTPKKDDNRKGGPVSWQKSFSWLKNGNSRFVKGKVRRDGQSKKDIKKLAKGQQPHAIVLSCSDSRVPPEIAFDQKLGEIFVVRAAGSALDSITIGSIEYAVAHLGSNLIVVLGHTSCGAVKTAHSTAEGASAGSAALDTLIHDIQPRIRSYMGKKPSADYMKESWANVKGVAEDLYERSEIVRQAMASGKVKIVESLYDLDTGVVTFH